MSKFLETYGVALFTLVLVAILIAFSSPLGMQIKYAINTQVCKIENIGNEEIDKTNSYTIVFDGNGATSGTMKPMTCVVGKTYTLPNCQFQKDGYTFSTIYKDKNDNWYYLGDPFKDIAKKGETIVLYVLWGCRVDVNGYLDNSGIVGNITGYGTFDMYINGKLVAENVSDFCTVYPKDSTYEVKNIKATKGHTYIGSDQPLYGVMKNSISGTSLIFITNKYTIHYNANGGTGTMSDTSCTYDKVATLNKNTFTRSGYTFVGWNTKADGSGISYTNIQDVKNLTDQNDVTINLYAQWQKNK